MQLCILKHILAQPPSYVTVRKSLEVPIYLRGLGNVHAPFPIAPEFHSSCKAYWAFTGACMFTAPQDYLKVFRVFQCIS